MPAFKAIHVHCQAWPSAALDPQTYIYCHGTSWRVLHRREHWRYRADMRDMGVSAKMILPWLLPDSCGARADLDPADRGSSFKVTGHF